MDFRGRGSMTASIQPNAPIRDTLAVVPENLAGTEWVFWETGEPTIIKLRFTEETYTINSETLQYWGDWTGPYENGAIMMKPLDGKADNPWVERYTTYEAFSTAWTFMGEGTTTQTLAETQWRRKTSNPAGNMILKFYDSGCYLMTLVTDPDTDSWNPALIGKDAGSPLYISGKRLVIGNRPFALASEYPEDTEAQYAVGLELKNDQRQRAIPWLVKAAVQGHLEAQRDLTFLYLRLDNVVLSTLWRDKANSQEESDRVKAAEQGDLSAQIYLAENYLWERDYVQVEYWATKALEQAVKDKNKKQQEKAKAVLDRRMMAIRLVNAAEEGDLSAQIGLAREFLIRGRDYAQAEYWATKALEQAANDKNKKQQKSAKEILDWIKQEREQRETQE
jgi:hypothetical protein